MARAARARACSSPIGAFPSALEANGDPGIMRIGEVRQILGDVVDTIDPDGEGVTDDEESDMSVILKWLRPTHRPG